MPKQPPSQNETSNDPAVRRLRVRSSPPRSRAGRRSLVPRRPRWPCGIRSRSPPRGGVGRPRPSAGGNGPSGHRRPPPLSRSGCLRRGDGFAGHRQRHTRRRLRRHRRADRWKTGRDASDARLRCHSARRRPRRMDGPIETGPGRVPTPTRFTATDWPNDRLANADDAAQVAAAGGAVLDARSHERFLGEVAQIDKRPGHIPGARCAYWADVLDADAMPRSADELRDHFRQLGVDDGRRRCRLLRLRRQRVHEHPGHGARRARHPGSTSPVGRVGPPTRTVRPPPVTDDALDADLRRRAPRPAPATQAPSPRRHRVVRRRLPRVPRRPVRRRHGAVDQQLDQRHHGVGYSGRGRRRQERPGADRNDHGAGLPRRAAQRCARAARWRSKHPTSPTSCCRPSIERERCCDRSPTSAQRRVPRRHLRSDRRPARRTAPAGHARGLGCERRAVRNHHGDVVGRHRAGRPRHSAAAVDRDDDRPHRWWPGRVPRSPGTSPAQPTSAGSLAMWGWRQNPIDLVAPLRGRHRVDRRSQPSATDVARRPGPAQQPGRPAALRRHHARPAHGDPAAPAAEPRADAGQAVGTGATVDHATRSPAAASPAWPASRRRGWCG